jgi:tetratricopeptide (TPR) repeat protein
MPRARRRHQSSRHRAHDELFGPTAGRSDGRAGSSAGAGQEPPLKQLRDLADRADAAGRPLDAIGHYELLLGADPFDVEARVALARLRERTDQPDLALALLDDGLGRLPERTELLLARARVYGQQRQHAEAEADLRQVLRLHPSHGPAYFELGLVLVRRGRAADAAEAFSRAIAFGPESADTYTELAEALNQSGRLDDAAAALERAVALGSAQPRAYNLMGRVLDRLHRSDEATLMYRRARELGGQ